MAKSRSILATLRHYLAHSGNPIVLFSPDRVVDYCNDACEQWTALPASQLLGRIAPYHFENSKSDTDLVLAHIAPPPETYAGQQARRSIALESDAPDRCRWGTFIPLANEDGSWSVLLIVDTMKSEPQESVGIDQQEHARLHEALGAFRRALRGQYALDALVGTTSAIELVRAQMDAAIRSRARVLVVGPAGSGREQVARTIFYQQSHPDHLQLVPLSCRLLDAELLQTTITTFIRMQADALEVTGPAALLLLDVDELQPAAQLSLLSILKIEELESHTLATARQPLRDLAAQGNFNEELAHFLSTITIQLPALVARREDIPLLAQKLLESCNARSPRQLTGFTTAAMDHLMAHTWPGNLDELASVIRAAHRTARGPYIDTADLPDTFLQIERALARPRRAPTPINLDDNLKAVERELISRALTRSKGNRARAARLLGISRPRLLRRMEQLGLNQPEQ